MVLVALGMSAFSIVLSVTMAIGISRTVKELNNMIDDLEKAIVSVEGEVYRGSE